MTDTEIKRSPINWLAAVVLLNTVMILALSGVYIYNRVHFRQSVKDSVCQIVATLNSPELEKRVGCPVTPVIPGVIPTPLAPSPEVPSQTPNRLVVPPTPQPPRTVIVPSPVPVPDATVTVPGNPPVVVIPTPTPQPLPVPTLVCILKICL